MTFMSDGDSSLSDPCSEDKSIASTQRRELVEGESSRTAEQSAYNLRPRKDDSVTMQRRSEFARLREQQNQRRKRRKGAEMEEIREFMECTRRSIKNIMDQLPKPRDVDFENRTEIINADTNAVMDIGEWRPYFSLLDIGLFKTTLKGASWEVEKLALQVAPFVVGIQSKVGDTDHFSCSGTVVEFSEGIHVIVTVSNLVKKCPDTDELADGLKINVYLHNDQTCEGHLLYHDFYYNICLIQIQSPVHLPEKVFSANIEAINFDKSCSRDVVTLGRDKETHILLVSTGKIIPKSSKFDCEELLVSTCRISKAEVGGPLMNFDGEFIGMNYYHTKETPFIPSSIVLKCLQQFTLFRKVVRPWHGLRVRTLYAEGCNAFEKMQTNFRGATGVIIEKIEEQSSAKASGLNEGDIINQVNGVYFSNAAELGGILLDIGTKYLSDCQQFHKPDDPNKMSIFIKFRVRGCEPAERTIVVGKFTSGGLNRWPFPKPIIVRKYRNGEKVSEEWYAMER